MDAETWQKWKQVLDMLEVHGEVNKQHLLTTRTSCQLTGNPSDRRLLCVRVKRVFATGVDGRKATMKALCMLQPSCWHWVHESGLARASNLLRGTVPFTPPSRI